MKRNDGLQELVSAAAQAATQSYSPYSHFPVGAALMTSTGRVVTGCNVENASYGLTLCAERVAVLKAVSEGDRNILALAVVGGKDKAARPCGACLQVLSEFCSPDCRIILAPLNHPDKTEEFLLSDLLPHGFSLKQGLG